MPIPSPISAGRVRSIYEFISDNRKQYRVQMMCRVLGVAPSGYYEWLHRPLSNRSREDARLLRLIQASFTDITYIRTWQGWLYLAVVMDLFSRKIVGWATRCTTRTRSTPAAARATSSVSVTSDACIDVRRAHARMYRE